MPTEPQKPTVSTAELARLRERAAETRAKLAHKPGIAELLTPDELADAAPFYFELRACIAELKKAREAAGLTLAQVAEKTGLAAETLCRLETGAITNPTWKTLGLYAAAVQRNLNLGSTLRPIHNQKDSYMNDRTLINSGARTILVYGHPDRSVPGGFQEEEDFRRWIGYEIFRLYRGRYRYTINRPADIIVLSRGGTAFGHFEIAGLEEPTPQDRDEYHPATCTYIVRSSVWYGSPVRLWDDVQIRVMPNPPPITETQFRAILALAGQLWEVRALPV